MKNPTPPQPSQHPTFSPTPSCDSHPSHPAAPTTWVGSASPRQRAQALWAGLLLGFALLVLSLPAHAKRVALLIGNSQYQHESVLTNPVRDVELLGETLRGMGFTTQVLKNLPKRDMDLAVRRFVRSSSGAQTAVFFYAGHGQQPSQGGRSYLLPVDANAVDDDALGTDGIPVEDIAAELERQPNPAKLRLVILDACRNTRASSRSSVRGLAPPVRTDSFTLIAYSTDANNVAQDGLGQNHSPYAAALAKHLPRAQREPVRGVFEDAAREVRAQTNQQQKPRTYGDLETRIGLDGVVLASGAPAPNAEQEAWQLAKAAHALAAYDAYLAEYPQGQWASAARIARASLLQDDNRNPPSGPFKDCADCPEMVVIPAGRFTMGSSAAEQQKAQQAGAQKVWTDWESPQRQVSVGRFAMGQYAVSRGEFARFVQDRGYQTEAERDGGCWSWTGSEWKSDTQRNWRQPGFAQGDDHPVVCVSWNDAQAYVQWLSQRTGKAYRLPSEAEREYATRAGSPTAFWWGESISTAQANYHGHYSYNGSPQGEYRGGTVPVSSFNANPFGLYNVHGNVWEWVQDCFEDNYNAGQPTDGSAHRGTDSTCARRVLRGGSWVDVPDILRSAIRMRFSPDNRFNYLGFRIARTVP